MARLDATSFGHVVDPAAAAAWRSMIPEGGAVVVADGPDIVGQALYADLRMTMPGGAQVPVGGVTWVAVAPTHRRRGLLRAMLTEVHERIAAAGYPLAALTASEGGIYGRFGYGPATTAHTWSVERRRVGFRSDAADPGGVRIIVPAQRADDLAALYDRRRADTPGGLVRPQALWDDLLADRDADRDGGTELFGFLHPDGYVLYRVHEAGGRHVRVVEFTAVTAAAHAALWRALAGLDLMERIEIRTYPGDPLPYLLTDARAVHTTDVRDDGWLRLVDVPAALGSRTYGADLSAVFGITAPGGDGVSRFAVDIRDGRAQCRPTDAAPDVELGPDVLGSLFLGGHRAAQFAAAGRLRCGTPGTVRALDAAFASDVAAQLGYPF